MTPKPLRSPFIVRINNPAPDLPSGVDLVHAFFGFRPNACHKTGFPLGWCHCIRLSFLGLLFSPMTCPELGRGLGLARNGGRSTGHCIVSSPCSILCIVTGSVDGRPDSFDFPSWDICIRVLFYFYFTFPVFL